MKMSKHAVICLALLGVGVFAVVAGATGAWVVLPLADCMLMMGWMMWMMVMGGMGHDDKK